MSPGHVETIFSFENLTKAFIFIQLHWYFLILHLLSVWIRHHFVLLWQGVNWNSWRANNYILSYLFLNDCTIIISYWHAIDNLLVTVKYIQLTCLLKNLKNWRVVAWYEKAYILVMNKFFPNSNFVAKSYKTLLGKDRFWRLLWTNMLSRAAKWQGFRGRDVGNIQFIFKRSSEPQ